MNETIFYSQLQPWTTVAAHPCMEQTAGPPVPTRIGLYFQTPRPHPWRPTLGYELVAPSPLQAQNLTEAIVDACYTPYGMANEPLAFPNLVTGFDRNADHAARAALYTRYTPQEWTMNNKNNFSESETMRTYNAKVRADLVRVMKETGEEKTAGGQRDSGRKIGERLTDLTFWRNEVSNELQELIVEGAALGKLINSIEKTLRDMNAPLQIAQECMYQREKREGFDLSHDSVEQALLKEMDLLRGGQLRMGNLLDKAKEQQRNNRAAQHLLETDVRSKEGALGIDNMCHQLNNFSTGLQYYGGIEKYDPTVSTTNTWAENSNRVVQKSQAERGKSSQIRKEGDCMINKFASDEWDAWSRTNNALAMRAAESQDTKSKLQTHLSKIQQELFGIEKNIEDLKKAIIDKAACMKVAQTRLESRSHRRGIENCRDVAQIRLVKEVVDMQQSIKTLHLKLQEAEAQHQQLLKTRSNLESDLQNKINSLFIDRDQCIGMRKTFPIGNTINY